MAKLPSFQFYVGDWLKDPDLRRCSKAAKGVWIDMMCLMFECEDRGVFASGGKPWTREEIAGAIGGDTAENLACIEELLLKGVAILTKLGAVSNRRMVRDEEHRAANRAYQAKFRKTHKTNDDSKNLVRPKSFPSSSSTSKQNTPPYPPQAGEEGKPRRLTRAQRRAAVGSNILWESAPELPDAPMNFADAPPGWCEEAQRHYAEGRMLTNLQRRYILSLEVVNA